MEARAEIQPGSLRRLVQASREWDKASRAEMRRGLRLAASKGADAAKFEVLGPPPAQVAGLRIRRRGASGLRRDLAGGVGVSIRTGREAGGVVKGEGVRVQATARKLPAGKAPMVKAYMAGSFRHPVFGGPAFVTQRGRNWFYRPLMNGREEYRQAMVKAIEAGAEAVAARGGTA